MHAPEDSVFRYAERVNLYSELARWWPLLSPQSDYESEGVFYGALFANSLDRFESLLELGCGSGFLVSHFPNGLRKVLVDQSPEMLEQCAQANPGAELIQADLRTLDLDEQFDAVLIHDALMYMTSKEDLTQAVRSAARHCRPGGVVLLLPDVVRERFVEGNTLLAGRDGEQTAVRLMEWHWDPDLQDDTFQVEFSLLVRESGGVESFHESHTMGLFSEAVWRDIVSNSGLVLEPVEVLPGLDVGEVFLARKPLNGGKVEEQR